MDLRKRSDRGLDLETSRSGDLLSNFLERRSAPKVRLG